MEAYSFRVKGVIEDYNEYKKFGHDQRKSVAASDEDDSDSVSYTHLTLPTNREV